MDPDNQSHTNSTEQQSQAKPDDPDRAGEKTAQQIGKHGTGHLDPQKPQNGGDHPQQQSDQEEERLNPGQRTGGTGGVGARQGSGESNRR